MSQLFEINQQEKPSYITIDNFYQNPDAVRELALKTPKKADLRYWKGKRSAALKFSQIGHLKAHFEKILNTKIIKDFRSHFHLQVADDTLVYHSDQLNWAAAIYLTPDAPPEGGTSLLKSKITGLRDFPTAEDIQKTGKSAAALIHETYDNAIVDRTKWEQIDQMANVYNRCVIWRGTLPHAVSGCFGHDEETGRLVQLFFFE